MSVVADTADVFVPSLEGFLMEPNATALTHLLSTIPGQFAQLQNAAASANLPTPEPILGPAVQAGLEVLKAANRCGKLFIMHSSLPTADAPGKLKFREDRHLIGTDKEKILLQPATDYYTKLGKDCVEAGASVDLFLFPNSFIDVATISEVPKLTSGNLFKYSYFQADLQGDQFIADLRNAVALPEAFNAVMRVRTSTGTRPFETLGNVNLPNTTDVEFAALDANQTVTCEIKYDDKLSENDFVFIQVSSLVLCSTSLYYRSQTSQLYIALGGSALHLSGRSPPLAHSQPLSGHLVDASKYFPSSRSRHPPHVARAASGATRSCQSHSLYCSD